MYRLLMILGGLVNIYCAIFHIAFWKLFNWGIELAKLSAVNHGTMEALDIAVIYTLFYAAGVSLYFAWARPRGPFAAGALLFIAGFYIVRAADEIPCYGFGPGNLPLIALCLALSAIYIGGACLAGRSAALIKENTHV
jgi:hypothetical protein